MPAFTRLYPVAAAAMILLAVSTLTRIVLAFRPEVAALAAGDLARSFALGAAFDLAAAVYALTPYVLWLALAPDRLARTWVYRATTIAWLALACFVFFFTAAAEWLFWDEFGARFNFIAVDYLLYTHEVIGNIWESYPTGKLLAALALCAAAAAALLARRIWRWSAAPSGWRFGLGTAAALAGVVGALTLLVNSDLKNRSSQDAANELAGNGTYEFFAALRANELSYERYYASLPISEALATVRGAFAGTAWINPDNGGVERLEPGGGAERKLNVVLVSIESMGAEFLGAYGDPRGLTPNLDRLA